MNKNVGKYAKNDGVVSCTASTLHHPAMPNREARALTYLLTYLLEQGGAAAGHQLIVPVATPWPPHHAMATDAAFGAPLMGAN